MFAKILLRAGDTLGKRFLGERGRGGGRRASQPHLGLLYRITAEVMKEVHETNPKKGGTGKQRHHT